MQCKPFCSDWFNNSQKGMTQVKSWLLLIHTWTFALQNLSSIYQLGFEFVKQLIRIQIQKGRKVLPWNQVKSRMGGCYSELILAKIFLRRFYNFEQCDKPATYVQSRIPLLLLSRSQLTDFTTDLSLAQFRLLDFSKFRSCSTIFIFLHFLHFLLLF